MKKLVLSMCGVLLLSQSSFAMEVAAPTDYIDFDALNQSIEVWRQDVAASLNENEQQLVVHFIKLGSLFSLVDLKTRQAVRQLLPLVWQLQEEVVDGKPALAVLREIEEQRKRLHNLVVYHDMLLKQWREWTNAIEVSENQKVLAVLEAVHEQVRQAIERCLQAGDWQPIAAAMPSILEDQIKTANLLSALCSIDEKDGDVSLTDEDEQEEDDTTLERQEEDSIEYFSWLTNAANLFNDRSWESIEAASQLLVYQEELLTMSGVIYNKYLRALSSEVAEQEDIIFE